MAKFHKKPKTHQLRRKGWTLLEISKQLGISKATASLWCQDVKISSRILKQMTQRKAQRSTVAQRQGAKTNHFLRMQRVAEAENWAREKISRLSQRDILLVGTGLYWGEGSKGRKLNFTNSDPAVLKVIKRWFTEILSVSSENFLVRVSIHESHRDRYMKVQKFWERVLKLPARQFYKPTFLKTIQKKVYENRETYYGVVSLRIRKSTNLQYRILGLIKAVEDAGVAQVVRAAHS